jgi:GMP reductase
LEHLLYVEMYFDFEHINLIPKKCIVESRAECDTSVKLGPHTFKLPVVPANMECVINDEIAIKLASNGYFYIHHRFNVDAVEFCKKMKALNLISSISIGVNEDAHNTIFNLIKNDTIPDYITIDIAHGHSIKMEKTLKIIRESFIINIPYIIAGNVSTAEAVRDLESWGANAIKVGIGPGSACTTYIATGFGSRGAQASVVENCANACLNDSTVIIADGGIKDAGDIAKSIVLGASFVMVGGLFSALSDSPGNTVQGIDGKLYKEFWGSASSFQSNKKNRIEGTKKLLVMKQNTILDEMNSIHESLQSAISYGGGNKLNDLKNVGYFIKHS